MWPSLHKAEDLYRAASSTLVDALKSKGIYISLEENPYSKNGPGVLVTGNYTNYMAKHWYNDKNGLHLTDTTFPTFCQHVFGFPNWGKQAGRDFYTVAMFELDASKDVFKVATANLAQGKGKCDKLHDDCHVIALQECPDVFPQLHGFQLITGNWNTTHEKMAFLVRDSINVNKTEEIIHDFKRDGGRQRNALLITLVFNGKPLTIANVHLSGGRFDEKNALWTSNVGRDIIVKSVIGADIILGDFNGEIDNSQNAKRLSLSSGNSASESNIKKWLDLPFSLLDKHDYKFGLSIHTVKFGELEKQVDFIFYNNKLTEDQEQKVRDIGSDHHALVKTFKLRY